MTKVTVDIDKSHLDEISKERIKDLERQLKNAQNREKKLKDRVSELEVNAEAVRTILTTIGSLALEYSKELDIDWALERA